MTDLFRKSFDLTFFKCQIDFGQNLLDFLWLLYKRVYETTNLTVLNIFGRSILILKKEFFGKNKKSKPWLWLFLIFPKSQSHDFDLTWLFDFRNKSVWDLQNFRIIYTRSCYFHWKDSNIFFYRDIILAFTLRVLVKISVFA